MTDMPKAQVEPTEVQPLPKHFPLAELVRGQGLVEPSAPNALLRPLCSSHSQLLGLRRSRILRATRPGRLPPFRQRDPPGASAPSSSSASPLPAPSSRCAQQVGHRAACLLDGLTRAGSPKRLCPSPHPLRL
eukprot:scaffold74420_cov57-Phaeocystis_antarctica.AAC.1